MQQFGEGGPVLRAITYPPELPVSERREEIAAAIERHPVVIVAGETGSGKTTQLPKICLELGRGQGGMIGHTQPRRLAARTVSARIARELGPDGEALVGYEVRFSDRVPETTAIKLMTDGILLNEIRRDRLLRRYDTLIIDEAHERSLNIDFLLGYLARLLPRRPDLKVLVTSATIDVESFSRHFDGAPVIEVSGRTFPVETRYVGGDDGEGDEPARIAELVAEIDAGRHGERGDVLVFLPGEREIRELAQVLRRAVKIDVLPLYARLSQAEQDRVFAPGRRGAGIRVVLATNVAETSLTVPGIRYVIDPGQARVSRYSHRTRLQRLRVEAISRASADQRRGRCGRVGPGVCLRLYSEADYDGRPEFTDPEILRTNLASVILRMLSLGLGEVTEFPFIEPPDTRQVRDGYRLLEELGAVDGDGVLTKAGRRMARFPVDPRLARMVLEAVQQGCLEEILVIASALSIQDPRERPADKRQQADQSHARFRHERSDFMAWLNLWTYHEEQRRALSSNQLRRLCRREFLSHARMREWRDVHTQLCVACRQLKLKVRGELPVEENYAGVHKALLSGLLGNIAQWHEGREYRGARERSMQIFPGSAQARSKPRWLVAAEIVETSRVFAREVGAIEPRWVIELDPPQLKRHYHSPRWQARSGRAVAYERVALYGLTLADKRLVHYGPVAPVESRELLIREGLVAGNFHRYPAFLKHNRRLAREVADLESRARRRDLLVADEVLFGFYDDLLPERVFTAAHLRSWLQENPAAEQGLYMPRDLLHARDPGHDLGEQFPEELVCGDLRFRLSYEFDPGGLTDGVSVTVPLGLLNRAPRRRFDWLVPGLLREKCIALVRGLPKEKRKRLVPAPDVVDRALAELAPADVDLYAALATRMSQLGGVEVSRDDWDRGRLDDFYRMNIRVVDAGGGLLGQGRDLDALLEQFREDVRRTIGQAQNDAPERVGITRWDFGELPLRRRFRQAGVEIETWPALEDRGDSVAITQCDYPGEAKLSHRLGVLRLAQLARAQQLREIRREALRGNSASLVLAAAGRERDALVEDMAAAAFVQALGLDGELPRDEGAFRSVLAAGSAELVPRAREIESALCAALEALGATRSLLAALPAGEFGDARRDIDTQLAELLQPGFQRDTPADWLSQYPRYMKALRTRVERLRGQYPKDQKHTAMLEGLTAPLQEALASRPGLLLLCAEAMTYRWMLEEFRVSLFAQNLGTKRAVSAKRLAQQWGAVEQWLQDNPR